ncbi:unnamed protein product [Paramecium sonneborni]|uniref:WD40-repeat-containing domain n=1 Tax=Paramecium sonneborni TaxID=65129 RepID=A0A8S1RUZ5_9CILI|nr:unnamed protein product [Paramecium sonneborni]
METVRCLILNKTENELISCSDDSTINFYSLQFQKSDLLFKYSLKKHEQKVTSICLNQSETTLISCSEDGQIIVWKKNEYDDWEFKNFVNHSFTQQGGKIVFIQDNQFIWTQHKEKIFLVFEEKDQIFKQKSNKSIIYENKQKVKFPFIYNSQFNLIICSYDKTIEVVKQQSDGTFVILSSFQNQINGKQKGVVTNDSKYLLIWNSQLSNFNIFKLYS